MFKSLKATVASAISSDPLYAFQVDTATSVLCGRGYLFERCDAVVRANDRKVSIFTLHMKRLLERCSAEEALAMVKAVRDGVTLLTHLRHPSILSIEGQLVEEKKKLWFATERVSAVLAPEAVKEMPLQVKLLGLCHCAEGIRFLHEKAEILLLNFALSSIYVTEGNRWKVGDLCFAVPRAQITAPPHPAVPFSSAAAPLLDYLPPEYIEYCTAQRSATDDLFATSTAPLVFPDSDTYSFLVVVVEVIDRRRLFNCGGNPQELQRQLDAAETRVGNYFPAGALRLPRPSISTVINTGPFATPDMRTLTGLASFDTLDSDARFRLLKGLYDGLGQSLFCEPVLLSDVVPLMVRESRNDAMLRFVLPILLLCANVLSPASFSQTLREYFVSFLTAVIRAPTLDHVAIYAEQVLQKREGLHRHFASVEDRASLIVPLLVKLLQCTGNDRIQIGALEWLRHILKETPTVKLGLPSDIATRLMAAATANPSVFALAFECVEQILTFATTEAKMDVEVGLTRSLGNSSAGFTITQLDYMLRVLKTIEDRMTLEHRALKSIPLLSPLLLQANPTVRQFAAISITGYVQALSVTNYDSPSAQPSNAFFNATAASPFGTASAMAPPVRHGPSANTCTTAPRSNDDAIASLFS